jgi:PKD repeat protein
VQSGSSTPNDTLAISDLLVTPNNSSAPMLSAVKWQISGAQNAVSCELDFGDGAKTTVANCSQVKDTFHTYEKVGGYVLILTAKEGDNPPVSKSFPVTVQKSPTP